MNNEPHVQVTELFRSIQGESTYQGLPCYFIRLTGCNLRCTYCDTAYSYEGGRSLAMSDLVKELGVLGPVSLAEVTGGEPLLQKESILLMSELLRLGYGVLLETNGSRDISGVPPGVIRIVDVKCPGSGMADSFMLRNLESIRPRDELKFVLSGRDDYDWACAFIRRHGLTVRGTGLLFSPVYGVLPPSELAEWIVQDALDVRLNLQLNQYIWGPGSVQR